MLTTIFLIALVFKVEKFKYVKRREDLHKLFFQNVSPSLYTTCDFDLSPDLLEYLPEKCHNVTGTDRILQKMEALSYKTFYEELLKFEQSQNPKPADENYVHIDYGLRKELYTQADLQICHMNATLKEFLDCLAMKRAEMLKMLKLFQKVK